MNVGRTDVENWNLYYTAANQLFKNVKPLDSVFQNWAKAPEQWNKPTNPVIQSVRPGYLMGHMNF